MERGSPDRSIWSHLVDMLDSGHRRASPVAARGRDDGQRTPAGAGSSVATVRVLGRQSESTICVSWLDPTACHYGDQIWKIGIARRAGVCALSHGAIYAGDLVYRPSRIRLQSKPVNLNFMILAAAVEDTRMPDA
ncbi:DUF3331 domain-containing protein [Burkholderia sp. AU30198]|uniref:DUF3331 domain-containing protein n=1 Tax=Burkholderia sp. AU30198 TaxID=2879627 RepID=UPI001CF28A9E|nr:DUF3331 domain-containing protein [Burkholderia sp. AU30198]MCA8295538.1 DUF3331 domain-containing protein [Burkholderia sp. AU30198]